MIVKSYIESSYNLLLQQQKIENHRKANNLSKIIIEKQNTFAVPSTKSLPQTYVGIAYSSEIFLLFFFVFSCCFLLVLRVKS